MLITGMQQQCRMRQPCAAPKLAALTHKAPCPPPPHPHAAEYATLTCGVVQQVC